MIFTIRTAYKESFHNLLLDKVKVQQYHAELMSNMWIGQDEPSIYRSAEMDNYFGLYSHLSNKFFPPSAYMTPITNLLQNNLRLATEFLIDFCNKTGDAYANSYLNKEYKECVKISIYVKEQKIEQIASDRLWKMYRGSHVGPDLLVSLLMGFGLWLFTAIENSKMEAVAAYCRDILIRSKNVMLTAIVVSVAEAYPEKMFDVGEMIAVARQESGARKLEGHDIMALERFDPEVTHMIVFDVLSGESPVGDKGERMRLFLTEAGYKKALENQGRSIIRILNHAKVSQGHLRYDRLDGERLICKML